MRNHKSLVETKSSHLRKKQLFVETSMKSIISKLTIYFSHSDVNEESQIIGPDKTITLKKTTVHQTSMKSIISHFTMYFSYSDENGDHKSFVETKSSHLRKITTVRRDLNEVYHFKTHDKFFTFR